MSDYRDTINKRGALEDIQTGSWFGSGLSMEPKDVQNTVDANSSITQVFTVINGNSYIGPTDPNRCESGLHTSLSGGLGAEARAMINGETVTTESICVGAAEIGVGDRRKDMDITFTTPQEEGQYDFKVDFVMSGDGERFARYEDTITVQSGTQTNPSNDPNRTNPDQWSNASWIMNNPVKAGGAGLLAIVATRTAIDSAIGGD